MIEQTVTALVYLHDNYRIASAGTDGFAVFFFLDDVRSSHSAFSSNVKLWDMRRSYTVHTQRPICCEPPIPVGASGKTTGAEIPLRIFARGPIRFCRNFIIKHGLGRRWPRSWLHK